MKSNLWIRHLLAAVAALCLAENSAYAQSFPSRAIRIVVPFPASGPSDFAGRVISQRLPELLGKPVVYDNRSGAAGAIAAELVAKSPPDGHTLLIANVGMLSIAPFLSRLPYDAAKDFAPITNLVSAPQWLAVHPSVPARTVKELMALARARPGQLNYGSAGVGQQSHLTGELFNILAGVNIVHVPYKGAAPAVTDLIGGQISMVFTTSIENLELAKTGRLRILAITSLQRSAATPDVPTMEESGLKGFEVFSWNGILAPAQTPREIINRLHADIVKALNSPEVKERVNGQGKFIVGDTPEEFGAYIRAESARWSSVIKQLGIKAE
jgi:tripartite-type tricarboxylate transporter receptor subunit TctC